MKSRRTTSWILLAAWAVGGGCTTLREVPRSEYATPAERKQVKITTHEGLQYEFDYTRVEADTLIGYRERDVEGPVREVATIKVTFEEIATLSVRGVDWYRSSLVGGSVLAAIVAAGLAGAAAVTGSDEGDTGGGGIRPPR